MIAQTNCHIQVLQAGVVVRLEGTTFGSNHQDYHISHTNTRIWSPTKVGCGGKPEHGAGSTTWHTA